MTRISASARNDLAAAMNLQDLLWDQYETPNRQPGPTTANQAARNADEAGLRVVALLGLQRYLAEGAHLPSTDQKPTGKYLGTSGQHRERIPSMQAMRNRSSAIPMESRSTCLGRYFVWLRDHLGHVSQQKHFPRRATHTLPWKCTQPLGHIGNPTTIDSADRPPILDRSRQLGPNQRETLPGTT